MLQSLPSATRRVLLISHDTVGDRMAGPGIRYYHLARVLVRRFRLHLAVPDPGESGRERLLHLAQAEDYTIVFYERGHWPTIEEAAHWAEVIILPSDTAADFPQLAHLDAALVIDGYDPLIAEWLALHGREDAATGGRRWQERMQALQHQFVLGDFFICASERQRDWWLGLLEAHGRVNPWTFREDSSLRTLIDVVPYGLPDAEPCWKRPVIKGVWPGIGSDDKMILWGGGLWLWLDPLTAIRAISIVEQQRQNVRLIFPGTRHPNPMLAEIGSHTQAARQLAAELGLLDRTVFFGDWIPYEDWSNVLVESDVALSLHFDTVETRLAFRSRVLEYIWARLPSVVTQGDATSDIVAQYGVGRVVDYGDVEAVAAAILALLDESEATLRSGFQRARRTLNWDTAAKPLIEFCAAPGKAPDRSARGGAIGHPTWLARQAAWAEQQAALHGEIERQKNLVAAYERGRFIRLMRWLHRLRSS